MLSRLDAIDDGLDFGGIEGTEIGRVDIGGLECGYRWLRKLLSPRWTGLLYGFILGRRHGERLVDN